MIAIDPNYIRQLSNIRYGWNIDGMTRLKNKDKAKLKAKQS